MNRVLNKDFVSESYDNLTPRTFSDVFHLACCMQIWVVKEPEVVELHSFVFLFTCFTKICGPAKENLMRSGTAC
jgi:hypothetical protein